MTEKPPIKSLLSDEQAKLNYPEMRALVGSLQPGPWGHGSPDKDGKCPRCKVLISTGAEWTAEDWKPCPVPDPDLRPLEVIVAELLKKLQPETVRDTVLALGDILRPDVGIDEPEWFAWWVFEASDAENLACILVALDLAVAEDQT